MKEQRCTPNHFSWRSFRRSWALVASTLATLGLFSSDYPIAFAQNTLDSTDRTFHIAGMQMSTLQGKTWMLSAWQEDRQAISLASDSITAQFADAAISGMGGCNRYRANYRTEADTIQVSAILSTRMACADPKLSAQETRYFNVLQAAQTLDFNPQGQLVIQYRTPTGQTGSLTFTALNAAPQSQSLDGSAWTLVDWQQGTAKRTLIAKTEITADFKGDRISGSGGCNRFAGTYRQQGETLNISNLVSTEMACEPAAIMTQETEVLNAIASIQTMQSARPGQIQFTYRTEQGETGLLTFSQSPQISQPSSPTDTEDSVVIQGNADGSVVGHTLSPPTTGSGAVEAQPPKDCP